MTGASVLALGNAAPEIARQAARDAMAFADGRLTSSEAVGIDSSASDLERAVSELRRATAGARANGLTVVGAAK